MDGPVMCDRVEPLDAATSATGPSHICSGRSHCEHDGALRGRVAAMGSVFHATAEESGPPEGPETHMQSAVKHKTLRSGAVECSRIVRAVGCPFIQHRRRALPILRPGRADLADRTGFDQRERLKV